MKKKLTMAAGAIVMLATLTIVMSLTSCMSCGGNKDIEAAAEAQAATQETLPTLLPASEAAPSVEAALADSATQSVDSMSTVE